MWFKGAVPRHAFTMWVAQQDRLPTRARLARWGFQVSSSCCLCNVYEENRDHLFLRYEVTEQLWDMVLKRLGYHAFGFHSWTTYTWLSINESTSSTTLRRVVAQRQSTPSGWEKQHALQWHLTYRNMYFQGNRLAGTNTILAKRKRKAFAHLMKPWLAFE